MAQFEMGRGRGRAPKVQYLHVTLQLLIKIRAILIALLDRGKAPLLCLETSQHRISGEGGAVRVSVVAETRIRLDRCASLEW
jgi:hypothetical protein